MLKDTIKAHLRGLLFYLLILFILNFLVLWFSYKIDDVSVASVLFQSISLITLTGFSTTDFYSTFSEFGVWAYTVLMQIDVLFYWLWVYIFARQILKLNFYSVSSYKSVVAFVLLFQILLFVAFIYSVSAGFQFQSLTQKIHFCLTYSISSFSNLWVGLIDSPSIQFVQEDLFLFHLVLFGGATFGALGYFTIVDLIHPMILRARLKDRSIDWNLFTKIGFFGSIGILGVATFIFVLLENDSLFRDQVKLEMILNSFYLSVSTRIGGINFHVFENMSAISIVIFLLLMVIGGAPGSVTGGIKISSLFLLFKKVNVRKVALTLLILVIFQFLSVFVILYLIPDLTFRGGLVLQFAAFFNVGVGGISIVGPEALIYLSILMLAGRLTSLLLPLYFFVKIKPVSIHQNILY